MNLLIRVASIIAAHEKVQEDLPAILESLKDKSIPLDTRWSAYSELVKNNVFIKEEIYGDGYIDTLTESLTMYDHFHVDRGQTRTFIDIYETIMEADGDYDKDLVEARETNLVAWQERVLESGYSSFNYDW